MTSQQQQLLLHFWKLRNYTDEYRKDETSLQLKMKKHYIKTWKKEISREHLRYVTAPHATFRISITPDWLSISLKETGKILHYMYLLEKYHIWLIFVILFLQQISNENCKHEKTTWSKFLLMFSHVFLTYTLVKLREIFLVLIKFFFIFNC